MASTSIQDANNAPNDIVHNGEERIVTDVHFHPKKDIIASCTIDGAVYVHSYSTTESNHELLEFDYHKKSCRVVKFYADGAKLMSASKDQTIKFVDLNEGNVFQTLNGVHKSPIYSMIAVDENIIASGDDDGVLKVWDLRQSKAVMDAHNCEEFISDMVMDANKRTLVASSGDGSLTTFDIRKHKMKVQSEYMEAELLCMTPIKNKTKLVVGSGQGVLNIYNWGEFGDISDRLPGHPTSIDCMVAINDSVICTGSSDGSIRAVNILPNRFLGVVARNKHLSIDHVTVSHCSKYIASCAQDHKIRFYNLGVIDTEGKVDPRQKAAKSQRRRMLGAAGVSFFADMVEDEEEGGEEGSEDDDSDDSDDSDMDSEIDGDDGGDITSDSDGDSGDDDDDDSQDDKENTTSQNSQNPADISSTNDT